MNVLMVDVAIAVLVAVLILILSPGLAISGVIGLLVLLALGLVWLIGRWRTRSRRYRRTTIQARARPTRRAHPSRSGGEALDRVRGRHR